MFSVRLGLGGGDFIGCCFIWGFWGDLLVFLGLILG